MYNKFLRKKTLIKWKFGQILFIVNRKIYHKNDRNQPKYFLFVITEFVITEFATTEFDHLSNCFLHTAQK